MVDDQLVARGITDARVIQAMRQTPRHLFVSEGHREQAYADAPLPIECGQTISQPYMVAVMTQALALQPTDKVLEIGTGSGYQAAVLSKLAREVVSVERHAALTAFARENLVAAGVTNVTLITGDGTRGVPEQAPFDAIIVTAGAPVVPDALKAQLADGGRLVCPTGSREEQTLHLITRRGDQLFSKTAVPCMFVPLIGEQGWEN